MMLYSLEYQQVLEREHNSHQWGIVGQRYHKLAYQLCQKHQVSTMLDYGSGQGSLTQAMLNSSIQVTEYDPGRPEHADSPAPHAVVFCCDVLEHVEPECIDAVLKDLQRVCLQEGFFTVATTPAGRYLNDGRNAHLIVKPIEWWHEKISQYFDITHQRGTEFLVTPAVKESA
jgi:2-polyprenyl-3-methyl-5-hydroxy-6-metoxy-1,4-benzoquinol methylase